MWRHCGTSEFESPDESRKNVCRNVAVSSFLFLIGFFFIQLVYCIVLIDVAFSVRLFGTATVGRITQTECTNSKEKYYFQISTFLVWYLFIHLILPACIYATDLDQFMYNLIFTANLALRKGTLSFFLVNDYDWRHQVAQVSSWVGFGMVRSDWCIFLYIYIFDLSYFFSTGSRK